MLIPESSFAARLGHDTSQDAGGHEQRVLPAYVSQLGPSFSKLEHTSHIIQGTRARWYAARLHQGNCIGLVLQLGSLGGLVQWGANRPGLWDLGQLFASKYIIACLDQLCEPKYTIYPLVGLIFNPHNHEVIPP